MPNNRIIPTEIWRSNSAGIANALTIVDKNNVKKEKLKTKPKTMPMGFLCPPETEAERTIGRTGKIQGESIVINPAIKEKSIRSTMH